MHTAVPALTGIKSAPVDQSNSVGLSYFDQNQNYVSISGIANPIRISIKNKHSSEKTYLPILNETEAKKECFIANYKLDSLQTKMDFQVMIKPINSAIGYLVLFKSNVSTSLNRSLVDYHNWKFLCPSSDQSFLNSRFSGLQSNSSSEIIYSVAIQLSSMNFSSSNTTISMTLKELNQTQLTNFCDLDKIANSNEQLVQTWASEVLNSPVMLTNQAHFWASLAGCFYFETSTGMWSNEGVTLGNVGLDQSRIDCSSIHLTDFAGGWLVLPPQIEFGSIFSGRFDSSIEKNPTVYATVIIVISLYILAAIWCRLMDIKDKNRTGVLLLDDNQSEDNYFYEVLVYTGTRPESATDSKVSEWHGLP